MDKDFQMTRAHLEWPDPAAGVTVDMHRAAWDRLRMVCRELGLEVPTLEQVQEMVSLPTAYPNHVVAPSMDTGKMYLVNFDIGYIVSATPYKA